MTDYKKNAKTYSVMIYPAPVEYEVEAKNKQEAIDKAVDIYTPNSMDVYKAVAKLLNN